MYKEINQSPLLKWRIPVDIALTGHKISLIIQATLGGIDVGHDAKFRSQMSQLNTDRHLVFQHACRLIRCIIDCELSVGDSLTVRNAMELSRSLGARAWDDSPLQLGQLQGIGPVAVRKLVGADIRTIEELESVEPHRIEMILSRNPPFGREVLAKAEAFPKPRVTLRMIGQAVKARDSLEVSVNIVANIGFINDGAPRSFAGKPVMLVMLAETSDGRIQHYHRVSSQTVGRGEDVLFQAKFTSPIQLVNFYISCEDIAGTLRFASLAPKLPLSLFQCDGMPKGSNRQSATKAVTKKTVELPKPTVLSKKKNRPSDEFADADLDDDDLLEAISSSDFPDIDSIDTESMIEVNEKKQQKPGVKTRPANQPPRRLPNGKWECNHHCKDKDACRHLCCNVGLDKKPAPPRSKKAVVNTVTETAGIKDFTKQTKPGSELKTNRTSQLPLSVSGKPSKKTSTSIPSTSASLTRYDEDSIFNDEVMGTSASELDTAAFTVTPARENELEIDELDLTSDDFDDFNPPTKRSFESSCLPIEAPGKSRKKACTEDTQVGKQSTTKPFVTMQDFESSELFDECLPEDVDFSDEPLEESVTRQESIYVADTNSKGHHSRDQDEFGSVDLSDAEMLADLRPVEVPMGTGSSAECTSQSAWQRLSQADIPSLSTNAEPQPNAKPADYEELKAWALQEFGDIIDFVD